MTLDAMKAVGFDKGSEITLFLVLTIPSILANYVMDISLIASASNEAPRPTLGALSV